MRHIYLRAVSRTAPVLPAGSRHKAALSAGLTAPGFSATPASRSFAGPGLAPVCASRKPTCGHGNRRPQRLRRPWSRRWLESTLLPNSVNPGPLSSPTRPRGLRLTTSGGNRIDTFLADLSQRHLSTPDAAAGSFVNEIGHPLAALNLARPIAGKSASHCLGDTS